MNKNTVKPGLTRKRRKRAVENGEFDAFAGGFPVPPRRGQVLPELANVVSAESVAPPQERPQDQQPANGAS